MYPFHDTTPGLILVNERPPEAMSYDGVFLEDEIEGYQTLSVSGREAVDVDVVEDIIGQNDGTVFRSKRYLPRTLKVQYQLRAASNAAFRAAYNKLNRLLRKEEARVIFQDEQDKYFIGTRAKVDEVPAGVNSVVGVIEIYCADPFKYAVVPKVVEAVEDSQGIMHAEIINEGAVPAVLDYRFGFETDNGYIGIASETGAMEFGCKDEMDGRDYSQWETVASLNDFLNAPDDTSSAESPLFAYTEVAYPFVFFNGSIINTPSNVHNNQVFMNLRKYGKNMAIDADSGGYSTDTLNLNIEGKKLNVCCRTVEIKADSEGEQATKSAYLDILADFRINSASQTGFMWVGLLDEDRKAICGVSVEKSAAGTKYAEVKFTRNNSSYTSYGNGKFNAADYDGNPMCGRLKGYGHLAIDYQNSNAKYLFNGAWHQMYDTANEGKKIKYVQAVCGQYVKSGPMANRLADHLGFYKIELIKKVGKWEDVRNTYSPGDEIFILGAQGKIRMNGINRPDLELLGSEYFKAPVGESRIELGYSSWIERNPDCQITVHEAWL